MCTLTWHETPDGYQVFFNRDERRERKPEVPPAVRRRGDTRLVAPLDGDFGGTWIAVNERALTVCLLNGFPAAGSVDSAPREYTSRGLLPLAVIERSSAPAVGEQLLSMDLDRYRPFVLVAFAPSGAGLTARWSGAALEIDGNRPPSQPLVSSSFYTEQVRKSRVTVFEQLLHGTATGEATAAHLAFHGSHMPERGPHSPCMHRPDASTVSFSRVEIRGRDVRFHYAPHAPCRGLPGDPAAVLERRDTSGPAPAG